MNDHIPDLRIEVRAKNNILYDAIHSMWSTIIAFCRAARVSHSSVGGLINLKISPLGAYKTYRPTCIKIADFLGYHVTELFPLHLYSMEKTFAAFEVPFSLLSAEKDLELIPSLDAPIEEGLFTEELYEQINRYLLLLRPKQRLIIEHYFGLNGKNKHTLKGLSKIFGKSVERIRQCVQDSIRDLQTRVHTGIFGDLE